MQYKAIIFISQSFRAFPHTSQSRHESDFKKIIVTRKKSPVIWFNLTVAALKVFRIKLFYNFSNYIFLNKNLFSENLSAQNIQWLGEKLKNHKHRFVKAKYANFNFSSEQTWLLLISIFLKLKIFCDPQKIEFVFHLWTQILCSQPPKIKYFFKG